MWKPIIALLLSWPCLGHAALVPDTTFGNAGSVELALPGNEFRRQSRVTVLPDRRIVVATVRASRWGLDWTRRPALSLVRLMPDGSADPTFGNGAPILFDVSPHDFHQAVFDDFVVRADGSVLVLVTTASNNTPYPKKTYLAVVTPDGRPDPAFNGSVPLEVSNRGYSRPKVFDAGSGYLVFGFMPVEACCYGPVSGFDAWRIRSDGTPDPGFGGGVPIAPALDRVVTTDVMPVPGGGFQILHVDSVTQPPINFWRRYRADGSLDTSFGNGGDQAIPVTDGNAIRTVYPLGDGTYAGANGSACVQRVLDAQGSTLSSFSGLCIGGAMQNPNVQAYGSKLLVSADQFFPGVPAPTDGTYLWVHQRDGAIDRGFAEPQGDRWRPAGGGYAVAADGDRGVVLVSSDETTLRVRRYLDLRGGAALEPVPALGLPALLVMLAGMALLARRRTT